MTNNTLNYRDLIEGFKAKGYDLRSYGWVQEKHKDLPTYPFGTNYTLYKIVVNPLFEKTLLITSGFHGEEFNGPISLLNIFDEAVAYATERRVRLIVYPCVNPSGFDLHQRYNPSDVLEYGNNDFLRYEIAKDVWVGTLHAGEKFLNCKIVDSAAKEVRFLRQDLQKHLAPNAALDIHQDDNIKEGEGNFYAYIFDKREVYLPIMHRSATVTDVCKNIDVENIEGDRKVSYRIDNDGFIFLHDGSITDMFYREDSEIVATLETNTDLAVDKVGQIGLIWIKGLTDLISPTNP